MKESGWALINLILMVLTVAGAVRSFIREREERDEYKAPEHYIKKDSAIEVKLIGAVAAAASIAAFFVTEDMSRGMIIADEWTLIMLALLAAQRASFVFVKAVCNEE